MPDVAVISISIVEDRAEVRENLRALLSGAAGFQLLEAFASMETALDALAEGLPTVLLVDLGLPGMSGVEGIGVLRSSYPKLAMIVFTVFDDDTRIFEAICAGANGYLLKNTPPAKLLEGIREVVDGGAPMSPEIARRVVELFRRFRPPGPAAHNLTPHETRILKLLVEGHNFKTAARELGVSIHTIGFHVKNIYGKLEVHSKTEAVAKALRHGFLN